jgi:hypothetical protein
MGRRVRGAADDDPASRWTGRLHFDVTSPGGGFLGLLELQIGRDDVAIFYADRSIGLVDRRRLHLWFRQPREPLEVNDVTLTVRGRDVLLALDPIAPPVSVPSQVARQLQAVV